MTKKIISILLAIIMVMGTFTVCAVAEETDPSTESKKYIYCSAIHPEEDGEPIITQEMADADETLEATKLYPGDFVNFHINTTDNLEIFYNPNGGFSVDTLSSNPVVNYTKSKTDYMILGMGDTINFVHNDGDFLYWIVTSVQISSSNGRYQFSLSAVWDIPESDGSEGNEGGEAGDTEEPISKFDYVLQKIKELIHTFILEPFYAALRVYDENIRRPFFALLDRIFGDLPLDEVPEEETTVDPPVEETTIPEPITEETTIDPPAEEI